MKESLECEEKIFIINPEKQCRNTMESNLGFDVSTLEVLIFVKLKLKSFAYVFKKISTKLET